MDSRNSSPARPSTLARALMTLFRGYQLAISPMFPPTCRFFPSCSHYCIEALSVHGAVKGVALGFGRLVRCNPWNVGGIDPVPKLKSPSYQQIR